VAQDETKVRAWNAKRADLEIARERKVVFNLSIDEALGHCVDDWVEWREQALTATR
jgi:hypothetical protein